MTVYNKKLAHNFLLLVLLVLFGIALWIFRPFIMNIIIAAVIGSFFYPTYKFILRYVKYKPLASFITTLLIVLIVIAPLINIFIYIINQAIEAYPKIQPLLQEQSLFGALDLGRFKGVAIFDYSFANYITPITDTLNNLLITVSRGIVFGTTTFVVSFLTIILTVFFLFIEGKNIVRKIMNLTPLPNKYDLLIFNTFRDVSYSTIFSSFAVAFFQGLLGGIGFWLAGLSGLFGGLMIAIASFVPYVGAFLVWGPALVYLIFQGRIIDSIILLVFGLLISFGDNVLRAYLIKGKAKVHELIVFFSIVGGVIVFGFWGVVIGPILISLLFTVINIYEEEFATDLEKEAN